MIQLLASKYRKHIAYCFIMIFYIGTALPVHGMGRKTEVRQTSSLRPNLFNTKRAPIKGTSLVKENTLPGKANAIQKHETAEENVSGLQNIDKADIGGPGQPEMSRFKAAGADNLVNLFTGDFSYNIPLMDVGGYPVNIFYDGGITPEQDASWVGLGWNINPGTVSRNMRGVPDDFDGSDILKQTQNMKPNVTWGFSAGEDLELIGVKPLGNITLSFGTSLDLSFNNYLGPALGVGIKGATNIKLAEIAGSEKSSASVKMGGGVSANLNSRSGVTLSPGLNLSLTSRIAKDEKEAGFGTGLRLGTSYNSRSGIKQLQLSDQMSFNYSSEKTVDGKKTRESASTGLTTSSTISFSKPSYIPALRMPSKNESYSGRFQLGKAFSGVHVSGEVEAYKQVSSVAQSFQEKPMVGYLYYHEAVNNPDAVMDFTRFNDNEVTPNTPMISAPQYSYDVFSIQGEGTGGMIRAYRDDIGYVRDNTTRSQDKGGSAGIDIGIPGHVGANFNIIETPTVISEWRRGNKLRNTTAFVPSSGPEESVYFRNPGETAVLNENQFKRIGGTDLVRFKLGGSNAAPTIEPILEKFSKANIATGTEDITAPVPYERKKRTQVSTFLRADEAARIGLDRTIRNYDALSPLTGDNNLNENPPIDRESEYRKAHHISQINVTEASGRRHIYGLPVYNITQKDFTFSVNNNPTAGDQVEFEEDYPTRDSRLLSDKTKDGFIQVTETPAYAHSFLLTGLLSPDYVDVTGNGISEDDLGDAVKFNYSKYDDHHWRTPLSGQGNMAHFNDGNRSERKDDKGIVTYGKRESWYLHSIESKTMIALFTLEDRKDGKGVSGEHAALNTGDNSQKRLKKIDLYSKSDLKKNGLGGNNAAKPVKTVWFTYSYKLCVNAPGNNAASEMVNGVNVNSEGKLTLDGIHFTFNGKNRTNKNKYVFSYGNDEIANPAYTPHASDRWGNYKPATDNPSLPGPEILKNSDHPYSVQDKTTADQNAGAWSLKKILLPSGGQIEVEYESDDYAFVQNRRAATMRKVVGLGKDQNGFDSKLYRYEDGWEDNFYVYIDVPDADADIKKTYLEGLEQLAFKLAVNMPKGMEYINCYAEVDGDSYGRFDNTTIWIRLKPVRSNMSPLTLSVLDYLRERLPGQAFRGYDVSESTGLKQIAEMLGGMGDALKGAFSDPVKFLRSQAKAQTIIPDRSFVRLNDDDGHKYGGGHRVSSVVLKDNWHAMTQQYTSVYGQRYDYTTTEIFDGAERPISSGVASYEPSIGSEENPFQSIVQVVDKLPLGPANYGAIEMPMLDAFFPAPLVGYSKVTVRSIQGVAAQGKKSRSGIGKQVTEFYTAKDFPVYYNFTPFDPSADKSYHAASLLNFFYKYAIDTRALSQGFIVETNDMHGKLKSQASYAEGDENSRINYTENFYRNTGSNGLNEKFDFVYASRGGEIEEGNMGIDVELMVDTREFSVTSTSYDVQGQVDLFPFVPPFWLPFIWPVSGNSENTYRAVTTTKAITYHGILDRVVVIDKGSMVTTKNLVYDAETGDVVVSETQNEFDKPIYNVNYPAYWAYSGMGPAYLNIGAVFSNLEFVDGKIVSGLTQDDVKKFFESGDELFVVKLENAAQSECGAAFKSKDDVIQLWAFDKGKNSTMLTNPEPDLVFIDKDGKLYNRAGVTVKITRSGKRNMLGAMVASVTTRVVPEIGETTRLLKVSNATKVLQASAMSFREKWHTDKDIIRKVTVTYNPNTCQFSEADDCNGELEKYINPYRKGLIGNFRPDASWVFYGDRVQKTLPMQTNLPTDGDLDDFKLFWDFDGNYLVPDYTNSKWVWNSRATRFNAKGMELETKNALEIYTGAQYGYHKTMPAAIASNARYTEIAYSGFEDKDYDEFLTNSSGQQCDWQKHINFEGSADNIIEAGLEGFNAHSGKNVLKVNANNTLTRPITVSSAPSEELPLIMEGAILQKLSSPGAQVEKAQPSIPVTAPAFAPALTVRDFGMDLDINTDNVFGQIINGTSVRYYLNYQVTQYTKITTPGTYTFTLETGWNEADEEVEYIFERSVLTLSFIDSTGATHSIQVDNHDIGPQEIEVFLTCGIYRIESHCVLDLQKPYSGSGQATFHALQALFSVSSNTNTVSYSSLDTETACNYTKPMKAEEQMMNPVFTIPANKKMLFSAWVRESDTQVPGYTNSKVQLQFNAGTNPPDFLPSGPVIEGWQKIEGVFMVPNNATTMNLKLVNTDSGPVYFDDIRIHPFNANMTSYVYDPVNLRLTAQLDANNYAQFYEYDDEGTLIRTKAETKEGVKTIAETRSFKQTVINQLQ